MSSRQALNFILFRHIIAPKFIFLKQATPTNKMYNKITHITSSTTLKTRSTTFLKEAWCKVNNSILFQGFSAARSRSLKTDISYTAWCWCVPLHDVSCIRYIVFSIRALQFFPCIREYRLTFSISQDVLNSMSKSTTLYVKSNPCDFCAHPVSGPVLWLARKFNPKHRWHLFKEGKIEIVSILELIGSLTSGCRIIYFRLSNKIIFTSQQASDCLVDTYSWIVDVECWNLDPDCLVGG